MTSGLPPARSQPRWAAGRRGRHTKPTFGYWPSDSDHAQIPAGTPIPDKTHGVVTIHWPALLEQRVSDRHE
jgi:hypothetical protein